MHVFRSALLATTALMALTACQTESSPSETVAKSARVASEDACATWIADITATCSDFLEGRESADHCSEQVLTVHTSYSAADMDNPQIGPRVCSRHLERLAERPATEKLPAVVFGDQCRAFGQQLKAECVDTLGSKGTDSMACSAKLSIVTTARRANDADRESVCEMASMMYKRQ